MLQSLAVRGPAAGSESLLGPREHNDLFELLDDRVGTRSTLITSQLPLEVSLPECVLSLNRVLPFQKPLVRGDKGSTVSDRARRDKSVSGIFVQRIELSGENADLAVDGQFHQTRRKQVTAPC
jgi:hypothetical protein